MMWEEIMEYPNLNEEKKLWKKGFECVVGLDEAGRGPLAGPVVAAAVMLRNFQFPISNFQSILNVSIFKKIKDSKKMTAKQRENVYKVLINHPQIQWGIGIVSAEVIDRINILEATKLAMQKAVKALALKMEKRRSLKSGYYLLIDGNFVVDFVVRHIQKSIIKGDQKVISISAASIIAKVTRDKIMEKFHKNYPQYGFNKHKGYGTAFHVKMIKKHGPCKIHRKSFAPISKMF